MADSCEKSFFKTSKMAPKWVDEGRFLQQPLDQILGVSLLQNGSKNGSTGVVGFRICDDVAHFLSKLMFSLDVFFANRALARVLEGSQAECAMTSSKNEVHMFHRFLTHYSACKAFVPEAMLTLFVVFRIDYHAHIHGLV